MKIKLLATLASVLMVGSMFAQTPSISEGTSRRTLECANQNRLHQLSSTHVKHHPANTTAGKMTATSNTTINAMQKVAELDGSPIITLANGDVYTIEGQYIIYICDTYYNDSQGDTSLKANITYDSSDGQYWIKEETDGYHWFTSDVPFTFSNNTLTFSEMGIGRQSGYYVKFSPFTYSSRNKEISAQSTMSVPFDPSTGVFSFNSDSGFGWFAYSNSLYTNLAGYWQLFNVYRGAHEPMPAVPDPEVNAPAYVMVGIDETIDLTSYFAEVEVAGWTTSESNVATVSGGVVTGKNYGEATVTATRSQGGEWGSVKVLVCPEVTVLYPEGVETKHLVGYGSPIDILLAASDGWRVCTASVEGHDITTQIDESGRLLSNMTVNDDTLVNIVTAKTSNPQWADKIRIVVDDRNVNVKGTTESDNICITNYRDTKRVYDWNNPEIPFSEGGVYNVKITNAAGSEAYFRVVIQ